MTTSNLKSGLEDYRNSGHWTISHIKSYCQIRKFVYYDYSTPSSPNPGLWGCSLKAKGMRAPNRPMTAPPAHDRADDLRRQVRSHHFKTLFLTKGNTPLRDCRESNAVPNLEENMNSLTRAIPILLALALMPTKVRAETHGHCMLACGGDSDCEETCDRNRNKNQLMQRLSECQIKHSDANDRVACKKAVAADWTLIEHNDSSPHSFFIPVLAIQLDRCALENRGNAPGFDKCQEKILKDYKAPSEKVDIFFSFPIDTTTDALAKAWVRLAEMRHESVDQTKLIYELKAEPSPKNPKIVWANATVMNPFDPTELPSFKAMGTETCQSDKAKIEKRQAETDCRLGCLNHFVPEQCEQQCVSEVKTRFESLTDICPPPPPPALSPSSSPASQSPATPAKAPKKK
jgi:hypothetical protein